MSSTKTISTSENQNRAPKTGGVRFAPSPTGRFHIGNLRTAWISYQWAKKLHLPWVIRFEDIDTLRVVANAQETQLQDMNELGLKADVVLLQSQFQDRHWDLFVTGVTRGQIYPCDCSRKEVQDALAGLASAPHDGKAPIYSGHCRHQKSLERFNSFHLNSPKEKRSLAWRFRTQDESGQSDFIVARTSTYKLTAAIDSNDSNFTPAYHWACAIDDWDGGYDLLVRSSDLAPAAAVQRRIQSWLAELENREPLYPAVFHTSLVTQNDGHRLEKRTQGVTLPEFSALGFTTNELLKRLTESFDFQNLNQAILHGKIIGESSQSIPLARLGLG